MITGRDGHTYVVASEVRDHDGYGDVTPAILRGWVTAGRLPEVTVAELAAALGAAVPAGVDPAEAARHRGRSGPETVYRWADVVRAETATRLHRRRRGGRPRSNPAA